MRYIYVICGYVYSQVTVSQLLIGMASGNPSPVHYVDSCNIVAESCGIKLKYNPKVFNTNIYGKERETRLIFREPEASLWKILPIIMYVKPWLK